MSSLAGNEFLKYNGTKWINSKLELSFSSLSDYKAVSPLKNGMIMTYNSTTEKWEAKDKDDEGCLWEEKVSTKEDGSKIYQLWPTNTSAAVCIGNSSNNITISRDKISLPTGNITLGTASISANNCIAGGSTLIQESSDNSIAFGESSSIIGKNSLVIGKGCVAEGNQSAAIGEGSWTKMNAQFVCGKYNKFDATSALFIVGNGSGTADDARSTAFYVTEGGKAFVQGGVELSSDSRMKTNVNTIGTALDNVLKLRGVTFYWDKTKIPSSSDNLQYGFIAQEVEKIFPDLVTTDSNGYKTMNYIGVIPVLTEAVKELKKENEELKSTLEDLLKRVEALENK